MGISKRKKWGIALATVLASVALPGAYLTHKTYKDHQFQAQACEVIKQQAADRGSTVSIPGSGLKVALIGDSYSSGDTLEDYRDAWPFVFAYDTGYSVTLSGVGWTGYVNGGVCEKDAFATRVSSTQGADLVIIQGGQNDVTTPDAVESAATELIESIDAPRVLLVGPTDAPAIEGEGDIDRALAAAATATGAEYVSALDWHLAFGPDKGHPSPEGHKQFASYVEDVVGSQDRTASTSNNP